MNFQFLLPVYYLLYQAYLSSSFVGCLSPDNIRELLDSHNFYREVISSRQTTYRVANINHLDWSEVLSARAAERVTCLSTRPARIQQAREDLTHVNVGRMKRSTMNLTLIVDRWFAERSNYLPEEGECFPYDGCQSFKTMINAKHTHIGCATAECAGRRNEIIILMCLYEGGVADQFGFQIGTPCTGCTEPLSFCQSNLCVRCNSSINQCDCQKTCMKDGVGEGQLNSSTCSCNCFYGDGPNCDQPCENREQYNNFDICSLINPEDCNDPDMGPHYREFCAEVCSCRRPPANGTNGTEASIEMLSSF